MPLKHFTETLLIALLAVVTVVMAILTRAMPAFPVGFLPLVLLTVAGLLYVAVLYPLLKRDRADYPFRLLHFVPAALPFAKLVGGALALKAPFLLPAAKAIGWGWMLLPVALFFFLVVWFCLSVIRRRVPRLGILALLFVPYAALAVMSESQPAWNKTLTAMLIPSKNPVIVAQEGGNRSSVLRNGETWGERLEKDLRDRKNNIVIRSSSSSSMPTQLPHAGPGMDLFFLTIAGYAGTLHVRAKKRLS